MTLFYTCDLNHFSSQKKHFLVFYIVVHTQKDILLDKNEQEYLFYRSNFVVKSCFIVSKPQQTSTSDLQPPHMSQKRSCGLSTKINRHFPDMVKIRVIII